MHNQQLFNEIDEFRPMPDSKTAPISTDLLEFDRHNPRLVSIPGLADATDLQIMQALVREANIGELVESICTNSYLDIEPLVVTKKATLKAKGFRVLEGNRRLCAIRLLKNQRLAEKCKIKVPVPLRKKVTDSIKTVTVYVVKNELESRAFIGFKHINGAHRWDSYAKARYLVDWYLADFDKGTSIERIAQELGDQNQTVRSLIGGMLVLMQAEKGGLFEIDDRTKAGKFGFSHLYTALARNEYRTFLGLAPNWNVKPAKKPVRKKYLPYLEEVLVFIYGSQEAERRSVIGSQNPDLRKLGAILAKPRALEVLRTTNDLKIAYDEVIDPSTVFKDALIIAGQRVKDALKQTSKFDRKDAGALLPEADEMLFNADTIITTMMKTVENKPRKRVKLKKK